MRDLVSGEERFYDLHLDPWENTSLLSGGLDVAQQVRFDWLKAQMALVNPN